MREIKEIKFRAWDRETNTMVNPNDVLIPAGHGLPLLYVDPEDGGGREIANLAGKWNEECDLVLMQYTGLKDKNGREIYEGDIVRLKKWDLRINGDYEIVWRAYQWVMKDVRKQRYYMFENDRHKYVEVIGNVWENPELLEAEL